MENFSLQYLHLGCIFSTSLFATKIDLPVKVIAYLRISSAGSTESLKKDLAPNAGSSDQCLTVEKRASNE